MTDPVEQSRRWAAGLDASREQYEREDFAVGKPFVNGQPVVPPMTEDERWFREALAHCYCGAGLYRDDGELQDSRMHPTIDFLRDPPATIARLMRTRAELVFSRVQVENDRRLQDFKVLCDDAALFQDAYVVERISEKLDGQNRVSVSVVLDRIPTGWTAAYCRSLGINVPDDIPDCAVVGQDGKTFEWVTLDFTVGHDGCLQENPGDYET